MANESISGESGWLVNGSVVESGLGSEGPFSYSFLGLPGIARCVHWHGSTQSYGRIFVVIGRVFVGVVGDPL